MLHYLRIAVTALSLTACVLLIALWIRSYWYGSQLIIQFIPSATLPPEPQTTSWFFGYACAELCSAGGHISLDLSMPAAGHSGTIAEAGISTHRFEYDRQFHKEELLYNFQEHGARNLPYTLRQFGFYIGHYGPDDDGLRIFMPHLVVVLAFGVGAMIPWIRWSYRFSLRTLLIATTLVAVGLGIIAMSS
ncbi:MAG TPA: hypothetical protein VGK58_05910 [Lacipirellulaceae bacterium]